MELRTSATYVRELRSALPPETFAPARSRLLWLPVNLAIVVTLTIGIARGWLPWMVWPLVSVVIGAALAGLTFLGHETLHGGVVRGRRLRHVIGWIGFAPFLVSPRLWKAWHNREHHAHANEVGADPDMYPVLRQYEASRVTRVITDRFALGGRRWTGILSLMFGFTGQSAHILVAARGMGMLDRKNHLLAWAETGLAVAMWLAVALLIGPLAFLFTFGIPLVIANMMVMTYILTNHGLSPLTDTNDPLVNSLSVTVPRWYAWITLGFGFHAEHHLFPAMSTRHGPTLRAVILERWPERYQSMPLSKALLLLHRTARVYADATTLADPRTGGRWPTLQPGTVEPAA